MAERGSVGCPSLTEPLLANVVILAPLAAFVGRSRGPLALTEFGKVYLHGNKPSREETDNVGCRTQENSGRAEGTLGKSPGN